MKKIIVVFMIIWMTMITVTPAFAGPYHRFHPARHPDHGMVLGLGILTAAIVTGALLYRPQAPVMVCNPPGAIPPMPTEGERMSVTTHILNVRSGPGLNFSVISYVYRGNLLTINGSAPGWLYVQLPNGRFGWVMAQYTAQISPPARG
jgi:uncharacterized protein YgiM (DUF1202 family)